MKIKEDTISKLALKNVYDVTLQYRPRVYKRNYNGFIKVMDRLVNFPQLNQSDRLVYSALRNYASNPEFNMKTNVTNATIANRLGIGKTTVSTSISKLQELGIISLHKSVKNQRIIKIQRDFYEKQQEEIEYNEKHYGEGYSHLEYDEAFDDDDFEF